MQASAKIYAKAITRITRLIMWLVNAADLMSPRNVGFRDASLADGTF